MIPSDLGYLASVLATQTVANILATVPEENAFIIGSLRLVSAMIDLSSPIMLEREALSITANLDSELEGLLS